MLKTTRLIAIASLTALILLSLAWELWLAPLRPGGSWLILKAIPLLLPLRGLLAGRRYTYQWVTLAIWLYFIEGTVRAGSDPNPLSCKLAALEALLSLTLFIACTIYARQSAPSRLKDAASAQMNFSNDKEDLLK